MTILIGRWTMACVVGLAATSACVRTSPSAKFALTQGDNGENVSLFYGPYQGIYGELLAVTDSSFIVMRGRVWTEREQATLQIANPLGVVTLPRRAVTRIEFGIKRFDSPDG